MLAWDKLSGTEADVVAVHTVAAVPRPVVEKMSSREFLKAARFIGGQRIAFAGRSRFSGSGKCRSVQARMPS